MPRTARIALQFLTRLPVHLEPAPTGVELGRSLLWYPAVGLGLGVLLYAAATVLAQTPHAATLLAAALVLLVWIASTGALHLDGLADLADAWVGGHGDRERTLALMKDPHAGAMAIVAVTALLIVKFAALNSLLAHTGVPLIDRPRALACVLPPLLARAAIPLLFASTPYVRAQGIASELVAHQSRAGNVLVSAAAALGALACGGRPAIVCVLAALAAFLVLRQCFLARLGGVTGDAAGALIEILETVALVSLALA
jgi:adenosylcobinamide-GDP ribazoletransferase